MVHHTCHAVRRLLLGAVLACSDEEGVRREVTRYRDQGALCLSAEAAGGTLVQAVLDGCSSSCDELEASCSVSITAGVIEVHGQGSSTRRYGGGQLELCTAACVQLVASCVLPPTVAGTYELRYGDRSTSVELPVSSPRTEILSGPVEGECTYVAGP